MGLEAICQAKISGQVTNGKLYLESSTLLFRGGTRLKIPIAEITKVRSKEGWLSLVCGMGDLSFQLGKHADKWADKIQNPPTRLQKMDIEPGMTCALVGVPPDNILEELEGIGATVKAADSTGDCDSVLLFVQQKSELSQLPAVERSITQSGSIWVVFPKGVAVVTEADVMVAAKESEQVIPKTCSYSSTHSALKCLIPVARRTW